MNVIKFDSTHCPKCSILKKKLDEKKIEYEEINDVEKMIKLGFTQAPLLEVDGKIMDFKRVVEWINNR